MIPTTFKFKMHTNSVECIPVIIFGSHYSLYYSIPHTTQEGLLGKHNVATLFLKIFYSPLHSSIPQDLTVAQWEILWIKNISMLCISGNE
jgi:hypothetical protein